MKKLNFVKPTPNVSEGKWSLIDAEIGDLIHGIAVSMLSKKASFDGLLEEDARFISEIGSYIRASEIIEYQYPLLKKYGVLDKGISNVMLVEIASYILGNHGCMTINQAVSSVQRT